MPDLSFTIRDFRFTKDTGICTVTEDTVTFFAQRNGAQIENGRIKMEATP
jgi:hypothetical protein